MGQLRQRHSNTNEFDQVENVPLVPASEVKMHRSEGYRRQICCKLLGLILISMLVGSFFFVYYTVASWRHKFSYLDPSASKLHHLPSSYVKKYNARCLDGSRPAFYISQNDPSRWMVYFGSSPLYWCLDAEDCALRVEHSAHATSVGLPDSLSLHYDGVLSSNNLVNKEFWNWTKVVIHQCDGASFLGAREEPFADKAGRLYYSRGYFVGYAVASYLAEQHGMFAASNVLFVGVSGSGVGLLAMAPSLTKVVSNVANVRFLLDSGYILDLPNFHNEDLFVRQLQSVFDFHHVGLAPGLKTCYKYVPNAANRWRCLLPKINHEHLGAPLFVAQSAYDPWIVKNVLSIDCTVHECPNNEQQLTRIHDLRRDFLLALRKITSSEVNGLWLNACWTERHAINQQLYTQVRVEQRTLQQALGDWMHEREPKRHGHTYMDGLYPSNPTCPVA